MKYILIILNGTIVLYTMELPPIELVENVRYVVVIFVTSKMELLVE